MPSLTDLALLIVIGLSAALVVVVRFMARKPH
jgi:hypothetical protein